MARKKRSRISDAEIRELYESRESRLMQERNDFFLPQIHQFVKSKKWVTLSPEYQRRLVWDRKKKSLLIESLLMNVPIPNVFLFETDLHRYEVMDGQQRLHTIYEFYEGRFALTGLKVWSVLNGLTYKDCPELIHRGLDRRRISATVLLAGSNYLEGTDVRRQIFERLNTGGVDLNAQELRNCFFPGRFNELLVEIAGIRRFNDIWEIPPYELHIDPKTKEPNKVLSENRRYRRMGDCELVLRFFAFRDKSRLRGSVKSILNRCMEHHMQIDDAEAASLRNDFEAALELSYDIFGDQTFRLPVGEKKGALSPPLYDAVMVAADLLKDKASRLKRRRGQVKTMLKRSLSRATNYELIVGKPNTAKAIQSRINRILGVMKNAIK